MKSKIILMVLGLLLVLFAYSFSQVPQLINYQGKLTTSTGAPVNDTLPVIFSIYADGGGTTLLWTETQGAVIIDKGIFNVLLGSVNPISSSVFDGSVRYLGVKVGGDPEITPRKPMVSVPYAYRAGSIQTNCHDCDSIFVNVAGPDSVYSSSGNAFLGKASGSSSSSLCGVHGYGDNTSDGTAFGGSFVTSSAGTGIHYGISGQASGSSYVYGGIFNVSSAGSGIHYGSYSVAYGNSSNPSYGVYGQGSNLSSGNVYGGYFETTSSGTGTHYGLSASGSGTSTLSTFGISGEGDNTSSGSAVGGAFSTGSSGTGYHFGIFSNGNGSSSSPTYGIDAGGYNTSSGAAYGGYFWAADAGTGPKYGVWAQAPLSGFAGYFDGNLTVIHGVKNAAVKVDNGEYRLLYCQESTENWFEDFGEGQLVNGRAQIALDPMFLQTVTIDNRQPLKVFITLTSGEPTNYVVNKGKTGFELVVSDKTSNATFDYRVVAKRKGYENTRLAKMAGTTPEEMALEQSKQQAEMEKERLRREGERKQMSEQQLKIDEKIR